MKKSLRSFVKITSICAGILIVLAITLQIIGSAYVKPMIGKKLVDIVRNGSDSLYRLSYNSMSVNLWTGSISIYQIKIYPDSTQFELLKNEDALPPITFQMNLDEGKIKGFNVFSFLLSKDVNVSTISTKDANITMYRHFHHNKPRVKKDTPPLWKLIQPDIKTISVGELIFDNIQLSYYNRDSSTAFQWNFEQFDTKISDILIDSASSMNTERLLYAGNIETEIHKISFYSADSLYEMKVNKVSYSLKNRFAQIDSLYLGPTLSKAEFYKKTKVEKDIYTLTVPQLQLRHFLPELFLTDNIFAADSLIMNGAHIQVYHDRVPPDDPASKLGKFPHQLLLNAPFHIRINKALGENIGVTYIERDHRTLQEGKLWFKQIKGEADYIYNDSNDIAKHPNCDIKVSGIFMKNTRISGSFKFDLTKTDGSFEAEANISPTDVTVLNPLIEALALARFKSFKTGQTYYKIKGNEREAFGYFKMPYTDLHLQVLNMPEEGKETSHKKLMSWVVKTFSHNANPGKDGELRIASNVRYERDIHRSFFNLIWKTMFVTAKDVAMKESIKKIAAKKQEKKTKRTN